MKFFDMKKKIVTITGAGGFIGTALTHYFLEKDYSVIGMARNEIQLSHADFHFLEYNLRDFNSFDEILDSDIIIHCAFMPWTEENPDSDFVNEKATMDLARLCEEKNKQFVFLSSFSAHEFANSHYGKHKFALENQLKSKHLVIKPGLVTGTRGLFSRLNELVSEKSIIPIIADGKQPLQLISVEELCEAIHSALSKNLRGVYPVASSKSITYLELLEKLAEKKNRSPLFFFIPVFIAALLLKTFGKKMPFTEENLKGLLQLRSFNTESSLQELGISIREL